MCTAKTGQQCHALLQLAPAQRRLARAQTDATEVLVLCGKQGEHVLQLAKEFPNVQFTAIDSSRNLPGIADDGTPDAPIKNVHVLEADSNPHTVKNVEFDIVLCVADYFSSIAFTTEDAKITVDHIRRSIKADGLLFISDVHGLPAASSANAEGNGASSLASLLIDCGYQQSTTTKCMFTLPEAALSDALSACHISTNTPTTTEHVTSVQEQSRNNGETTSELSCFLHDALQISELPGKGRVFLAACDIEPGTKLLVDTPYGIIPEPTDVAGETLLICSNIMCNRSVNTKYGVRCLHKCYGDVMWCNDECRLQGSKRHDLECEWLSTQATIIEEAECRRDFGVMWLVIRLHIRRYLEMQNTDSEPDSKRPMISGGEAINQLAGGPEWLDAEQLSTWTRLIEKHIIDPEGKITHSLPAMPFKDWLKLLGQEETNSFGLYKGQAGQWPLPPNPKRRGISHGAAVYPLASVANHSCMPNIIRNIDGNCRMIYTSSRAIAKGEEICITYFDLAEYTSINDRREFLYHSFCFFCDCPRCADS